LAVGQAEARAQEDLEPLVRGYVRKLEDRQRAVRDESEKRLTELGPAVLPLLPPIDSQTSGELKQRLERIREQLEKLQARSAAEGSHVTLKGKMSLVEALAALEKQTGNQAVDFRGRFNQQPPDTDREVEVDFDNVPYWQALDRVLDLAGLTVYNYGAQGRSLALIARPEGGLQRQGRAAYSGLFRVEATSVRAERDLRNPQSGSLVLTMEVIWEPRVLPIIIRQALDDIQIQGDEGETLTLASMGMVQVPVQSTVSGVDIHLPIELPSRDVHRIGSLKGRFTALVPGREEVFEFANLAEAQNVEQKRAGLSVTLDRVRRNADIHEIRVRLRLQDAAESLQSHLDWVANNQVALLDPQGNKVDEPNFEKYLERENEVGYAYLFPLAGELTGYKFIYKTPAVIIDVPVEYELKEIPLP
jgi:hypothetical protein